MNSIRILDKSAKLINDLIAERSLDRIENDGNPIKTYIRFYKEKRTFCVDIESSLNDFDISQHEIRNSIIDIGYKLRIPQIFISNRTSNKIKGLIAYFYSEEYNESKPLYNRLLIPYKGKVNFTFSIENLPIKYRFKGDKSTRNPVQDDKRGRYSAVRAACVIIGPFDSAFPHGEEPLLLQRNHLFLSVVRDKYIRQDHFCPAQTNNCVVSPGNCAEPGIKDENMPF